MLNVLVIAEKLPAPDQASGDLRFFEILKLLSGRCEVDFCVLYPSPEQQYTSKYSAILNGVGVNVLPPHWRQLEWAIGEKEYDLIFCEFWVTAEYHLPLFRRIQPWAPVVIDSVDVHFLREQMGAQVESQPAGELAVRKEQELNTYRQANAVIVVTEEDGLALKQNACNTPQYLIPNIVNPMPRRDVVREPRMVFVGGFRHRPNLDGILWFMKEIWPLISTRNASASIDIVGSAMPPEVQALSQIPGVELHPDVPSTAPFLDRAKISIAPLRYGAGMKGKVTEAMANEMAVVTTSIGAQGLHATNDVELCICDEPQAFADACLKMLADDQKVREMGIAARNLITGLCSTQTVEKRVQQLLEDMVSKTSPRDLAPMRRHRRMHRLKALIRPVVWRIRELTKKLRGA